MPVMSPVCISLVPLMGRITRGMKTHAEEETFISKPNEIKPLLISCVEAYYEVTVTQGMNEIMELS